MIRPLALSIPARDDLVDAAFWYETQRKGLSEDLFANIDAALKAISERPESFPLIRKNVRRALVKRFPFAIYFREEDDYLVVLAIMHTARSPRAWRKRI